MAMRICFLNPFGTPDYDAIITQTLAPSLRSDTDVEVRHLENAPRNIDYYVPKHLVEIEILKAVLAAEGDGFDAFVIGCCYDTALTQARKLATIPTQRSSCAPRWGNRRSSSSRSPPAQNRSSPSRFSRRRSWRR